MCEERLARRWEGAEEEEEEVERAGVEDGMVTDIWGMLMRSHTTVIASKSSPIEYITRYLYSERHVTGIAILKSIYMRQSGTRTEDVGSHVLSSSIL